MTRNTTLFVTFSLFITGLAAMAVWRDVNTEDRTVARLTALSTADEALRGARAERAVLPDLQFRDRDGTLRSLADFSGRVVLLNIWATWCAPCRKEMRSLDRLQQSLGSANFEVLALSVDENGIAPVDRFYRDMALESLRVYVDAQSEAPAALAIQGIPTTLLIDTRRREVWRITGPVAWERPDVIASLRRDIERQLIR